MTEKLIGFCVSETELSQEQQETRDKLIAIGKRRKTYKEETDEAKKKKAEELNERMLKKLSCYKNMICHLHDLCVQTAENREDTLLIKTEHQLANEEADDSYYRINFILKDRDVCIRAYEVHLITHQITNEHGVPFKSPAAFIYDAEAFVMKIIYA